MRLVNPKNDAPDGAWVVEAGALVSTQRKPAKVSIPYSPPANYVLEAEIRRKTGDNALFICLLVGGRRCDVVLDAQRPRPTSGIERIDSKVAEQNETAVSGSMCIQLGQTVTVAISVHKSRITVFCDGRCIADWSGAGERLGDGNHGWAPASNNLSLYAWDTVFEITKLQLKPLSGERKPGNAP